MQDEIESVREGDKEYPVSHSSSYGVASVSRIDKIIGLFCRILSLL